MSALAAYLARAEANGVHDLRNQVTLLDGRALADKAALLAAVGTALDFPPYYGHNWDALEECLNDLSWREGPALLAIVHADALRAEDLATLADIFALAAEFWRERGRACGLILL